MEGDETIEALLDLDDLLVGDEEEEELEEGEFLPTEVEDWNPNDKVLPDMEEDIDEHIVISQSKTGVVFDTVGGEVTVDLSEIQNAVSEEDNEEENESVDMDSIRDELKKS